MNTTTEADITKGTIFEGSTVGLDKWLCAILLTTKGWRSHTILMELGICNEADWYTLLRAQNALYLRDFSTRTADLYCAKTLEFQRDVESTFLPNPGLQRRRDEQQRIIDDLRERAKG